MTTDTRYVQCAACSAVVRPHSIYGHYTTQHPGADVLFTETDRDPSRPPRRVKAKKRPAPVTPRPPKPAPITGWDIVQEVVVLLYPKGAVPTTHLDAVVRWSKATDTFLKEIT